MILRKLNPEENIRARALYEEVFPEDDDLFVDYYFNWKTRDNVIYAAENEEGIQATVHLNPFWVYWNGEVQRMHYIVAVATREEYRHQGLMRRLLAMAEQDMQEAGEKFTFLMPANENIYLPFGYRFFAWQRQGILRTSMGVCGKDTEDSGRDVEKSECSERTEGQNADIPSDNHRVICRPVKPQEYQLLADFVNAELKKTYDMFIWRDAAYYERLCAEQQCQGGDVMVICRGLEILGTFCTSLEESDACEPVQNMRKSSNEAEEHTDCEHPAESQVLREIILDTSRFSEAEKLLFSYINTSYAVKVEGCQRELKLEREEYCPLLMGKIPGQNSQTDFGDKEAVFINEVV